MNFICIVMLRLGWPGSRAQPTSKVSPWLVLVSSVLVRTMFCRSQAVDRIFNVIIESVDSRASNDPSRRYHNHRKAPTRTVPISSLLTVLICLFSSVLIDS